MRRCAEYPSSEGDGDETQFKYSVSKSVELAGKPSGEVKCDSQMCVREAGGEEHGGSYPGLNEGGPCPQVLRLRTTGSLPRLHLPGIPVSHSRLRSTAQAAAKHRTLSRSHKDRAQLHQSCDLNSTAWTLGLFASPE